MSKMDCGGLWTVCVFCQELNETIDNTFMYPVIVGAINRLAYLSIKTGNSEKS